MLAKRCVWHPLYFGGEPLYLGVVSHESHPGTITWSDGMCERCRAQFVAEAAAHRSRTAAGRDPAGAEGLPPYA